MIDIIAQLRRDEGFTLEDLADRSGLHRTTLGLLERGERGLTISSAQALARALDTPLSVLVGLAERSFEPIPTWLVARTPRRLPDSALHNDAALMEICGLSTQAVRTAVEHVYDTLDLIDAELTARTVEPIAGLVELANLSSMIGNLVGAGLADASGGLYARNRPHAFPDLVPQEAWLPDLEIKTALETNSPKGHLPKAGTYLTFRYVLGHGDATYERGRESRGRTAWIWEVRAGRLEIEDFSISNTAGDSGKTAVVKGPAFKNMTVVLQDDRFFPYARPWG